MYKKITAFMLVLSMLVSQIAVVSAKDLTKEDVLAKVQASRLEEIQTDLGLGDNEEVRIIVELEKEPVLAARGKYDMNAARALESYQTEVKQDISRESINLTYEHQFTNTVNGFSATTTIGEAKKLEKLPEVKRVFIANKYEKPKPDMISSGEYVDKGKAVQFDSKYNGEGTIVAIIDTGIDYTHKDMRLSEETNPALNEKKVDYLVRQNELKGRFYTEKVPYGYNYFDRNDEVIDIDRDASMHGMHVAGTVGANTADEEGINGVKGIAPETQLLAMKVFGNNPGYESTYGDIIIAAIDDAIALGADVINMSLGSTSGFVDKQDLEQEAVQRATEAGIICSISAGNSSFFGERSTNVTNMDTALVGSPGLSLNALQVASMENSTMVRYGILQDDNFYVYGAAGPYDPKETFKDQELTYVSAGVGQVNDVKAVDLKGKVALIKRGAISFTDKIKNAYDEGAIGVVIWNHESGGEDIVNMSVDGIRIPAVFIPNSAGAALDQAQDKKFTFTSYKKIVTNPSAGKMSDFSSWGPVSTLDLKPEITGPGGEIYSTFNDDQYGMMSGTSMSAPHVAGIMALIYQRIEAEYPELEGEEKALFAKNLAMSSAKLQLGGLAEETPFKAYITPRQQGAGLINIHNAVRTPVVMTDVKTNEVEVDLLEIKNRVRFKVKLTNLTDQDVTGQLKGIVQSPYVDKIGDTAYLTDLSTPLYKEGTLEYLPLNVNGQDVTLDAGSQLTVPANSEVELLVKVDLSSHSAIVGDKLDTLNNIFPQGTFVEGYLTFDGSMDEEPFHLASIPFMGYYGEWDELPILDATYIESDRKSIYNMAGFLNQDTAFIGKEDGLVVAGLVDGQKTNSKIMYLPTMLRNAKELQLSVLDENKNYLKTLEVLKDVRKNYKADRRYTFDSDLAWDLTVNGKLAPSGKYYLRAEAVIDFKGAKVQVYDYPIYVDHSVSKVKEVVIGEDKDTITVSAEEKGMGVDSIALVAINAQGEVAGRYETKDGVFSFNEIKKNLFAGFYGLIPVVYSKNGAADIGDMLNEYVFLQSQVFDGIQGANFKRDSIVLNLGKDKLQDSLNVEVTRTAVSPEISQLTQFKETGNIRRVVYTNYDPNTIEFVDNSNFKGVKKGTSEVNAVYVANDQLLTDLLGAEEAVATTSAAVTLTTPGVFRFIQDSEVKLKDYQEGKDYFSLRSRVIVDDTEHPVGVKEGDKTPPQAMITSPEYNSLLGEKNVSASKYITVTGTVLDESEVNQLYINEVDISDRLVYNKELEKYEFSYDLKVNQEGSNDFYVRVVDMAGNEVAFDHRYFYDETAPLIAPRGKSKFVAKFDGQTSYFTYPIMVKDCFASYSVYVNDNLVAKVDEDFAAYKEYSNFNRTSTWVKDLRLPLQVGENTFVIKAVDAVGNVSTHTVTRGFYTSKPTEPTTFSPSTSGSMSSSKIIRTRITKAKVKSLVAAAKDKEAIEVKGDKVTTSGSNLMFSTTILSEAKKVDKDIKFDLENVKVTISPDTFSETKDTNLELTVKKQKAKEDGFASEIFDFNFKGTKAKKQEINTFNKPVLLTLPVKIEKGNDVDDYAVHYYNETTKSWDVVGGVYNSNTKTMTVPVSHFSKYAVKKNAVSFEDVEAGHWAKGSIERLASKGVINGKAEETFDPEGVLTYAEFIKLMVEAKGLTVEEVEGKWYNKYLEVAADEKIITTAQKVKADEPISREDMAVIISRVVEGIKVLEPTIEVPKPVSYVDTEGLADDSKKSIAFVSEQGLLKGRGNELFAPKATLTRAEAAVVVDRLLDKLYK